MLLDGEISEAVLQDMNAVILGVYDKFRALDIKAATASSGRLGMATATQTITSEQYSSVIRDSFANKGLKRLEALLETAKEPHPSWERKEKRAIPWKEGCQTVQYDALFKEDENFEAGPFLHMYRLQYLQERREFLLEVERQLRNVENAVKGIVTASQCIGALKATDPKLTEEELQRLHKAGFSDSKGSHSHPKSSHTAKDGQEHIKVKDFLANIRRVVLRRFSPHTILVNGIEVRV